MLKIISWLKRSHLLKTVAIDEATQGQSLKRTIHNTQKYKPVHAKNEQYKAKSNSGKFIPREKTISKYRPDEDRFGTITNEHLSM